MIKILIKYIRSYILFLETVSIIITSFSFVYLIFSFRVAVSQINFSHKEISHSNVLKLRFKVHKLKSHDTI